jgi:catechol 2,3-dioxygenase
MARINKVGHIVLSVKDFDGCLKFYSEVLGMEVMALRAERKQAFLSFGTQHHDIALFGAPEGAERGKVGMNHMAMQIDGGLEELNQLYQQLLDHGAQIDHLSNHGITESVYFLDPDGNRLEIYCETMTPEAGKEYIRNQGGTTQPLVLEGVKAG